MKQRKIDFNKASRMTAIWNLDIPEKIPHIGASTIRFILFALEDRLGTNSECWPTEQEIATKIDKSQQTVRRGLRWLESRKFVITEKRFRGRECFNYYSVMWGNVCDSGKDRTKPTTATVGSDDRNHGFPRPQPWDLTTATVVAGNHQSTPSNTNQHQVEETDVDIFDPGRSQRLVRELAECMGVSRSQDLRLIRQWCDDYVAGRIDRQAFLRITKRAARAQNPMGFMRTSFEREGL